MAADQIHNFDFFLLTFYFLKLINQFEAIMQNKPNLPDAQMNVNTVITKDYENERLCRYGQNKPNSNPICKRVKLMQSVYLQRIMKKNAAKGYEKTNPIQTQFLKIPDLTGFYYFLFLEYFAGEIIGKGNLYRQSACGGIEALNYVGYVESQSVINE